MRRNLLFILISFAGLGLIILAYSNHFDNGFHFDDSHTIEDNIFIRNIDNIPLFFRDCRTSSNSLTHQGYRPLVTTTLAIDYWLGGSYKPFYFHLSIFIIFILQLFLMSLLIRRILDISLEHISDRRKNINKYLALFGALLYGVHTANAETINYIISRSDVLSTISIVASLTIYALYPGWRRYYLWLLPAVAGMFAKESTIMFAPILLVYIILFEQNLSFYDVFKVKHLKKLFKSIILALPVFVILIMLAVFSIRMTANHNPGGYSFVYYVLTQPIVILHYFISFFFPLNLSADTDWGLITNPFDDRVIIGLAFIILLIVIAFKSSRSKEGRPVAFGISWFLLALLPTSLIPLAEVLNDHRMFFPFVGLTLAVVGSLQKIPVLQSFKEQGETKNKINSKSSLNETKSKRQFVKQIVILSLAVLILLVFSYSTYQRNKVWQDEETLWYDVTVKSPKNGRGLMNYGLTQMSKGDYENALKYFEQALVYTPYYSILHINLGICKGALGKLQDAENHFKKAIELNPDYDNVYYYYGRFLSEHHRRGDAMEMLIKSVNLNPASLDARYLLMDIYNDFEMWEQLKEQANQTLSLLPGDERSLKYLDAANNRKGKLTIAEEEAKQKATPENYLNLSLIYYQAGLYDKCIAACYEALKLKADYAEAYNNICSAYNALGKWKDAMEACNKAIEIKPDYQLAKNNLNWAKKQSNK